ncbi:hypothetical protein ITJ64_10395 [Herbiconiux sp. VKM Ac-1786]|uniref:arsenate reductase/protein-tyrosine-phosphatase family protein n=1 Tax=Herbiconiux sp. VKM Ac-1786 TaxID=2783824 RepID=UPI00188ABC9B|nr:hypothetical protein [Herbiconiux sp. VKM Ac-1786]MBF4572926.1 hypothetical protein [Herbiconiux sp. VKM Ac-1786]
MIGDIFGSPVAPVGPTLITFVCTGNICRSPLAEKVLRLRMAEASIDDILVSSVGLHAVVGSGMDGLPAEIASREGADPAHLAVQADAENIRASSLVLTMTREQRSELVREFPFALKRTFTLAEFVRILEESPPVATRSARSRPLFDTVVEAGVLRSSIPLSDADDVDDPYRRSPATHERVGSEIIALVDRLMNSLAG